MRRASERWLVGALLAMAALPGCPTGPDAPDAASGSDGGARDARSVPLLDGGPVELGRPCTTDDDCEAGRRCFPEVTEEDDLVGAYTIRPGGLCSVPCDPEPERRGRSDRTGCATDERCLYLRDGTFETPRLCVPRCDPTVAPRGGCAEGWACDPETSACTPGCTEDRHCQPGCVERDSCPGTGPEFPGAVGGRCDVASALCVIEPVDDRSGEPCRYDAECGEGGSCAQHLMTCSPGGDCGLGFCTTYACEERGLACRAPASLCTRQLEMGFVATELPTTVCAIPCTVGAGTGAEPLVQAPGCPPGVACWASTEATTPEEGACFSSLVRGSFNRIARRNLGEPCTGTDECWSPYGRGACESARDWFAPEAAPYAFLTDRRCQVLQCDDPGLPELCGPAHRCTAIPGTTSSFCAQRCERPADCEAGFACVDDDGDDDTSRVCIGACLSDADCDDGSERVLRCVLDERERVGRCQARSLCEAAVTIDERTPVDERGEWTFDLDFSRLPRELPDPGLRDACGGSGVVGAVETQRERAVRLVPEVSGLLTAIVDDELLRSDEAALLSVRTECAFPLTTLACQPHRLDLLVEAGVPVTVVVTDVRAVDHHRLRLRLAPSRAEGEPCDPRGVADDCGALRCITRDARGPVCAPAPSCEDPLDFAAGLRVTESGLACWSAERLATDSRAAVVYRVPRDMFVEPPLELAYDGCGPRPRQEMSRLHEGDVLYPEWRGVCRYASCPWLEREECDGDLLAFRLVAIRQAGEACDPTSMRDRCDGELVCTSESAATPRCALRATSCDEPIPLETIATPDGDERVFAVSPGLGDVGCLSGYLSTPTAFVEIEAWADGLLELVWSRSNQNWAGMAFMDDCAVCPSIPTSTITAPPQRAVRRGDRVVVAIPTGSERGGIGDVVPMTLAAIRARILPAPPSDACAGLTCDAGSSCHSLGSAALCEEPQAVEGDPGCWRPSALLADWDGSTLTELVRTEWQQFLTSSTCTAADDHGLWLGVVAPRSGVLVAQVLGGGPSRVAIRNDCTYGDEFELACEVSLSFSNPTPARAVAEVRAGELVFLWAGSHTPDPQLTLALATALPAGAACDHDSLTEACGAGLICADLGGPTARCVANPWR